MGVYESIAICCCCYNDKLLADAQLKACVNAKLCEKHQTDSSSRENIILGFNTNFDLSLGNREQDDLRRETRLKIVGSPVRKARKCELRTEMIDDKTSQKTMTGILRRSQLERAVTSPMVSSLALSKRKRGMRKRSALKVRWSDQKLDPIFRS